ncbi:hypothetical protein JCM8097_008042 [Rhodosporidiobolus ruineniae]
MGSPRLHQPPSPPRPGGSPPNEATTTTARPPADDVHSDSSQQHHRTYSRTFPMTRAAGGGTPAAAGGGTPAAAAAAASSPTSGSPPLGPAPAARPSLTTRPSIRPSFISLPSAAAAFERGFPSPHNPDVVSPHGGHSVSSADGSTTSRITAPDLGGSNARYFPMRNVMYPSSSSAGGSAGASSSAGPRRGPSSVSARSGSTSFSASDRPLNGPAASAEAPLGGAGTHSPSREEANAGRASPPEPEAYSREGLERSAEGLGMLKRRSSAGGESRRSRDQPPMLRRESSRTEGVRSGASETSREAQASQVSSDQKPPSLDPFLPEPTTHAKHGDPESDEEEDGESNGGAGSDVQVRDFQEEEQAQDRKIKQEPGNRVATEGASTSYTGGSEKPLLMTTRFEHQITDDGEILVLTGREGQLERCEDEPIHAPGAIQAFGVLIAFDVEDDGRLRIKQVSENSGFILGLPPRTLFRTKSLTDIFDEDEADALLDALDMLDDRDSDPSNEDIGPYTFTISGRGLPGTGDGDAQTLERLEWTCHAAIHRPSRQTKLRRVILELELVDDQLNPLTTVSSEPFTPDERGGFAEPEMYGENGINPTEADLLESTVSIVKPLRTLARMKEKQKRKSSRRGGRSTNEMDIVGLLSQINDQLSRADDLETFLKVTAGVFRELTEFDRVMIYQFDEAWNGRVVAEQVDYSRTKDLFRGLNFPASDIPAQARELYRINKVRLLYDRDQPTARLCCRSLDEVDTPLDMTHCHLRAMSPIHIKYLGNMGVRSSMSVSITAFGDLWGLVSMHTYGRYGHRISFPVRQLCVLLGQSISRNIERISYSARLQARKLINTAASDTNPSGYIVAKAEDLLDLFHADFGILSIGDEAKILGPVSNSQELLAVLEYLRIKQFTGLKSSQDIQRDFPDIDYPNGFQLIAGLLSVPLSAEGKDFIVFFRKGQLQEVRWAGNPYQNKTVGTADYRPLEPRKSFKVWSETVVGKSRAWTDEEKETANVLCLVYGKFIAVWREKESALAASQLTNLLLANASHEVRTPLNAIINYLELALDGPIEGEVRENLVRSHAASRSLIHTINDLLDLTRTERGNELFLTDPFNLAETLEEAISVHREEARHRGLTLDIVETPTGTPPTVLGDRAKMRQIITNVVANAIKHTREGGVLVEWGEMIDQDVEDALQAKQDSIRIGISITDTGVGFGEDKLENIFRQFEQVSTIGDKAREETADTQQAVGLGLAVVARIVRNLNGQLSVESKVNEGTKFTFIFPFRLPEMVDSAPPAADTNSSVGSNSRTVSEAAARSPLIRRRSNGSADSLKSGGSSGRGSDIDSLINAMSSSGLNTGSSSTRQAARQRREAGSMSTSSRSTNSAQSRNSFHTAQSQNQSSAGSRSMSSSTADARSAPGSIGISDSRVPLRPARVRPSAGADTSISPLSSPSAQSAGGYFSIMPATPSPLGPQLSQTQPSAPRLRRSSTAAATIGSPVHGAPPLKPTRKDAAAMTVADTDMTPRPASPAASPRVAHSPAKSPTESMQHISEYRKSPQVPDDHIEPMRILVVEDEKVNRMIIQQRLKKDGHEVVVAEHGAAAVRKFEEDRNFDIVLMDLQMPILNGYDASKEIRRVEREAPHPDDALRPTSVLNRGIPILAVSASLPERERPALVESKLNGWLLKPIDFKRLKTLMRGATDPQLRANEIYQPGQWERGGWLSEAPRRTGSTSSAGTSLSRLERSKSQQSEASGLTSAASEVDA